MMLLDICPTLMMYETTDMEFVRNHGQVYILILIELKPGFRILALVLQYHPLSSRSELTSTFREVVFDG